MAGSVATGLSGYQAPGVAQAQAARPMQQVYRPDVGANLTDQEYAAHQEAERVRLRNEPLPAMAGMPRPMTGMTGVPSLMGLNAGVGTLPEPAIGPREEKQLDYDFQARTREDEARLARESAAAGQHAFDHNLNTVMNLPGMAGGPGGGMGAEEQKARAAAFARQKDTAASTARASVDALNNVLGERGLLGGGYEAAGLGTVVNGAQNAMTEFGRDQAITDVNRAAQIDDRNFTAQQDWRQSLLGLLKASGGGLY